MFEPTVRFGVAVCGNSPCDLIRIFRKAFGYPCVAVHSKRTIWYSPCVPMLMSTPATVQGGNVGRHAEQDGGAAWAERARVPLVVVLDEFQAVLTGAGEVDAVIRSEIQHHDQAGYVFAGSRIGTMREPFADRSRPFYAQAASLTLGPLPRVLWPSTSARASSSTAAPSRRSPMANRRSARRRSAATAQARARPGKRSPRSLTSRRAPTKLDDSSTHSCTSGSGHWGREAEVDCARQGAREPLCPTSCRFSSRPRCASTLRPRKPPANAQGDHEVNMIVEQERTARIPARRQDSGRAGGAAPAVTRPRASWACDGHRLPYAR